MQKATIICLAAHAAPALERLRALGVLHLDPLEPPTGAALETARTRLRDVTRALDILPPESPPADAPAPADSETVLAELLAGLAREAECREALHADALEIARLEPLGDFDPAAQARLEAHNLFLRLYVVPPKAPLVTPEGAALSILARRKEGLYVAVLSRGAPAPFTGEPVRWPAESLAALEARVAQWRAELTRIDDRRRALTAARGQLTAARAAARPQVEFLEARAGMQAHGALTALQGYLPTEAAPRLQAAAAEAGWGLALDEPGEQEQPPTLVRNPVWLRPIRSIFLLTGLVPGYREVDISLPFLIFLSLFFAMLIGDAGYGLLFIGLTAWARHKMPRAPAYPFHLLYLMSGCTVIWGVLTGTYFGIGREALPLPYSHWLQDQSNLMGLCFLIGALHLTVAHAWNAWRLRASTEALGHLGWIGSTWVMYFVARRFVLNEDLPGWVLGLLAIALLLIILFMTPRRRFKAEWFNHAMLPLTVISNFTDVVSYLRLFAVGTASFAVANAFNTMLAPMFGSLIGSLAAALLLFLGHALNIALCGLGILVHGVRLNTLEFSSHLGMQWTGRPYRPFTAPTESPTIIKPPDA
ncbi:MAG: hypothetical protein K9N49_01045 [Candidatus Marinimicrobia bacterium]|nr:hypothetical protein [Candidatus Neomarinimicrobiota bacterium]